MYVGKEKLDGVKRFKIGGGFFLLFFIFGEEIFFWFFDGELNIYGLEGGVDIDGIYN